MDMIIDMPGTISLMFVYGIGIIVPVLMQRFGFWYKGVIVSIVIATFCVFSLFSFLKGVNTRMKTIFIDNLAEEAEEALDSGLEMEAVNRVRELEGIGKYATKQRQEKVSGQIIAALVFIGTKALDNTNKDFKTKAC